ncbi:MAG: hypothetical protein KKD05_07675 [Candidatus Omnitrophica bacterium]|nr:hypothetical protein [Candidatus Omnitrophota bacterium]
MSKKLGLILVVLAVFFAAVMPVIAQGTAEKEAAGGFSPFGIYYDRGNKGNHYVGSGWMGDYGDIKFSENEKENPYSGKTCIKIIYTGEGKQGANWAGMYWQWPPNNWGEKDGGYNLTGATKLTFWARGANGGEQIMEFKIGGLTGTYSDTDSASVGPIELTAEWQQYSIDLTDLDLAYISGGFSWVTSSMANPEGCVFYLDDIQYE